MHNQIDIQLAGGKLELNENAEREFFVTKKIHQLQDLQTRDSETSKELTIPRTPQNIRLLGRELPSFRGDYSAASAPFFCEVLMFDITIINDALLYVLAESLSEATITIGVFGGAQKFFNQISTDSIRELNFTEFNIEWTAANLAAITETTEGLLYAKNIWQDNESIQRFLIEKDGINDIDLTFSEVEASGAWFFVKTIFKKILENTTGLTFDNSFLDAPFFDDMVLALPITQLLENWGAVEENSTRVIAFQDAYLAYGRDEYRTFEFNTLEIDIPVGSWDAVNWQFISLVAGLVNVNFLMDISFDAPFQNTSPDIVQFYKNDQLIFSHNIPVSTTVTQNFITSTNVEIGDRIYIKILPGENPVIGRAFYNRADSYSVLSVVSVGGSKGNYVVISDYLPDMTQKDFVKDVFKFGHIVPLEVNNHIRFYPWELIYNQPAFDLTPYLDVSQAVIKQSLIQGYGKNNHFKYTASNAVERIDTDAEIPQDSAILQENVTKIQSRFIPCDDTELNDSGFVVSPVFSFEYEHVDDNKITIAINQNSFTTTDRHGLNPGDHIFVWDDQNLVTMRRKVIDIVDDFEGIVDTNWTTGHDEFDWDFIKYTATPINFQIAHARGTELMTISDGGLIIEDITTRTIIFTDSLRWDEIIREYYYNFRATVYRPLVFTAWFNIPLIIFKQMSFGTPVYIGGVEAAKFYVNNAEQYKIDTSVRMELIRLESFVTKEVQGEFTVEPESPVNLGNWKQGDPLPEQIYIITNTGLIDLSIRIVLGGEQSQNYEVVTATPIIIPPGGNAPATIRFLGSELSGGNSADINFNDVNSLTRTRQITTNVQVFSYTCVPEGTVNLGDWNVGGDPLTQQYIVTNDGDQPLSVAFNVTGDGYTTPTASPLVLAPGANLPITVAFTGDILIAGVKAGVLNLIEASAGNIIRNLTANVVAFPVLEVTPLIDVDMGDWGTGDPPLTQIYLYENLGNIAIDVDMTLVQDQSNFVITTSPNFTVLPFQGQNKTIEFIGSIAGGLHECVINSEIQYLDTEFRNISATVEAIRTFTALPVDPVDLGTWEQGDPLPTQDYLLTNTGNLDLIINSEMFGLDAALWSVQPGAIGVPYQGSAIITVTFLGAIAAGEKLGQLLMTESVGLGTNTRTQYVTVFVPVYSFTVEPVALVDLGNWEAGDPNPTQIYTITNTGNVTLLIDVVFSSLVPSEWSINDIPIIIQPQEILNRIVSFLGSATVGVRSAAANFLEDNAESQTRQLTVNVLRYPNITLDPPGDITLGEWTGARLRSLTTLINNGGYTGLFRTYVDTPPDGNSKFVVDKSWRNIPVSQTTSNIDFYGGGALTGIFSESIMWELEGFTPVPQLYRANSPVAIPVIISFEPNEDANLGTWIGANLSKLYLIRNSGSVVTAAMIYCIGDAGFFPSRYVAEAAAGDTVNFSILFDGTGLAPGVYNTVVYAYCPNGNTITFNATATVP